MHDIRLRGARTHNLQNVSLDLSAGQLVILTGPSGAGKSSLAMDTLYAEGQRRFVESFSPYARQFLERLERPPIDSLDPVAATVAVDRRAPVKSSRSTLATMSDLEPYLAALFAIESLPVCPECGVLAEETSAAGAAARVLSEVTGSPRAVVSYALGAQSPEHFLELRDSLALDGYRRLMIHGQTREIDVVRPSEAMESGADPQVIVDRLKLDPTSTRRVQQAIESAWERSAGKAEVHVTGGPTLRLARGLACPECARRFEAPVAGLFSYNSALGACASCKGFGRIIAIDWEKVIPDASKSLAKGAIKPWGGSSAESERGLLKEFCARKKISMDAPWGSLGEAQKRLVIEGEGTWTSGKFPGVRAWFKCCLLYTSDAADDYS
jgi:excinuclease ABC subunit A